MYNELKPCPFCGSTEVVFLDGGVYDEMRFQIECQNCGATVGFINESRSDDELGGAWNTRSATERKSKTMTLDEAIEHCEEVAQEADKKLVDKKEYEGLTKKQIPQKPVYGYDEQDDILCPVCKETVGQMDDYYFGRNKYCPECGQRIDWK